jgi:AmmeMemoRadiSam system protein B/AmmeMemoRadiSam system protein A
MAVHAGGFAEERIRPPAVAGQFYTADPAGLRDEVAGFIGGGEPLDQPARIIVSPHAGYLFSGPVAGKSYAAVSRSVRRVLLIGPAHRVFFEGVSIPDVDGYRTPLGVASVDTAAVQQLRESPLVRAEPRAHQQEHCLEVQLPFLQVALDSFVFIPILCGKVRPAAVAELLMPLIDSQTLVVASSDFSHYLSHDQARGRDSLSIEAVLRGDMHETIDACGETPIKAAMLLARSLGCTPALLDARTSYDTAPMYGSESRVVGYASIVFTPESGSGGEKISRAREAAEPLTWSAAERKLLLHLARSSLEHAIRNEPLPAPDPDTLPRQCRENLGCFVTLKIGAHLRGCIGYLEGIKPLYQAVIENARNAGMSDPRFPAVRADELEKIRIEISVLTTPHKLTVNGPEELLASLSPGRDGLILRKGHNQATFLPQVWEQLPSKTAFLEHLSMKAGLGKDGWRDASYRRYFAAHFSEQSRRETP